MKKLMTSRRNFITIIFVIAVIFFLFMFSGAAKDILNRYGENTYAYKSSGHTGATSGSASGVSAVTGDAAGVTAVGDNTRVTAVTETGDEDYAICVGRDDDLKTLVRKWCEIQRRGMISYLAPGDIHFEEDNPPVMIVADGEHMSRENIHDLMDISDKGITIVMATMPKYSIIERDDDIRRFLGIEETRARNVWLDGIYLYGGFLVGGGFDYVPVNEKQESELQDLKRNIPWYTLLAGTKAYMVGKLTDELMEEQPKDETLYQNFNLPAIVWRNSTKKGNIFCVNSNYMADITGYGFLSAMEYESSEYVIYPVVNAQSTVLINFPTASAENGEVLDRIYSRNSLTLERDVIWPGVAGVAERYNMKLSCMFSTKIDQSVADPPNKDSTIFFMKLLKEIDGEAGISLKITGQGSIEEKLKTDRAYLDKVMPGYVIQMAYIGDLDMSYADTLLKRCGYPDVTSLILSHDDSKPMMGTTEDGKVFLRPVNDGDHHTFSDDLRMRSIQTILAYSMVALDITDVLYPIRDEDQWQRYYDRYASYSTTFFEDYDLFEEVTASVAARRAGIFLGIDYDHSRSNDIISVTGDEIGAYYMVRTHGEKVSRVIGGDYKKVDDDTYIIHVYNRSASVILEVEGVSVFY